MTDPLERRVRDIFDRLPAGERRLAEVVLDLRSELAAYSATELAGRAGVSKATAARLVRRLGYSDFRQMRRQARDGGGAGSPLAELSEVTGREGTLGQHLGHDLDCLTRSLEAIRPEALRQATRILAAADRIWVAGFRNSYVLAFYAREVLAQLKADVRLLPVAGQTVAEDLASMEPRDALLAFGFRRRPPVLGRMLRCAREAKSRVILIGDPSLGETARSAHLVFRCFSRGSSLFDSYVGPMSLINYLGSNVAVALGERAQERMRNIERIHDQFSDFEP